MTWSSWLGVVHRADNAATENIQVANNLTIRNAGLLSHKRTKHDNKVLRFGTWNIRTMLQSGVMNSIAEEIERYGLNVVALQEIRWKGKGYIKKQKFTMHYSGNEDRQGFQGVGFMTLNKINKSVLG